LTGLGAVGLAGGRDAIDPVRPDVNVLKLPLIEKAAFKCEPFTEHLGRVLSATARVGRRDPPLIHRKIASFHWLAEIRDAKVRQILPLLDPIVADSSGAKVTASAAVFAVVEGI
jgi:hypothetical protein